MWIQCKYCGTLRDTAHHAEGATDRFASASAEQPAPRALLDPGRRPLNYPIAIACGLTLLAFVAHTTGGVKQSLSISPARIAGAQVDKGALDTLERNWVQAMCAFQLVTVDLLVLSGVLYMLAFTNVLAPRQSIAFAVAGVYFLWGCSWLVQLFALKRQPRDYLFLGHWAFWFLCAGLIYWGALAL